MENYTNEFPQHWLNNPNILYHGTSNIFEEAIDKGGLRVKKLIGDEVVDAIMDIYENILREHIHKNHGGIDVIKPYYKGEIARFGKRPISFALHPSRCTMYASKDFAGGEHIRAIYRAIKYLNSLAENEEFRNEFIYEINLQIQGLPSHLQYTLDISSEQLKNKLKKLAMSFEEAQSIISKYQYGVIYAVDFSNFNTSSLSEEVKGIYAHCSVRPENIIGKCILTEAGKLSFLNDVDFLEERICFWKEKLTNSL